MDMLTFTNTTDLPENVSSVVSNRTNTSNFREVMTIVSTSLYGVLFLLGFLGNGLVIYVILRYTKMKTVTNLYILNLSIADGLFLMLLPMLMTTVMVKKWIFGEAMCKIYFIINSINMFTGAFTLFVMAGDRFMAVCYPISSMRFRTIFVAKCACACTWVASFLVMFPVVLYSQTSLVRPGYYTCTIKWPDGELKSSDGYITYTSILGFVLPVFFICILYTLLLIRLKSTGPAVISAERRRSHRKITKLVTLIIAVYIFCWLPYWMYQIRLIAFPPKGQLPNWEITLFTALTFLSYANSMLNPFLYAFTNEAFRDSFIAAFKCLPAIQTKGGRRRESEVDTCHANNNHNNALVKRTEHRQSDNEQVRHKTDMPCEMTALTEMTCSKEKVTVNGTEKREHMDIKSNDIETVQPLLKQA